MPVFHNVDGKLKQLNVLPLNREKHLQKLVEDNLLEVLDMHFLYSEYQTTDRGRIDTLAIDSDGAPVIIEYKRNRNDNVINQALSYLKWLKSQKVEFFEMLVIKKLGHDKVSKIDWKNPKVICIAEEYNKFDIDTLEVISVRLELYKFRYYENNIFTLENVKGDDEQSKITEQIRTDIAVESIYKKGNEVTLDTHLKKGLPAVQELFLIIKEKIFELDENIEERINNNYIGYRVSKMFAEVHIQKNRLMLYLRPIDYKHDIGNRIFKVSDSYNWVLDRRVYINNDSDIEDVMNLVEQSYLDVL